MYLNESAELLSTQLQENFQIYLEWSWQLMSLGCFFQQWILIYLFIFYVTDVAYEINWINKYLLH